MPGCRPVFFCWGPARWEAKRARGTAWFALDSPLTLCFRFPGANLGPGVSGLDVLRLGVSRRSLLPPPREPLKFRSGEQILHIDSAPTPASGRVRPAFSRRGLLPSPREPLRLRFGEQILHTNSAPTPGVARLSLGAVCSPLPASPCSSVPGSKFFTQIPRRRPGPAGFSKARFAPPSPQTLAAPFRGANSSHNFRASARVRPAFSRRGLLPPPREPMRLRPGEQILHTNSAPQAGAGRLFQGAVCSPLLAIPCSSVPGSKFFTQIPRRRLPPAAFSEARFAPLPPLTLEVPSRGANSSHKFRADARVRPAFPRRGLLHPPR